jgi:NAD-dependent dihydropyrimidine dehydrogenase PreA subunit
MAYVITQPRIGVKDASCVEVCPVDCIQYRRRDRCTTSIRMSASTAAPASILARWTRSTQRTRARPNGRSSSRSTPTTSRRSGAKKWQSCRSQAG